MQLEQACKVRKINVHTPLGGCINLGDGPSEMSTTVYTVCVCECLCWTRPGADHYTHHLIMRECHPITLCLPRPVNCMVEMCHCVRCVRCESQHSGMSM